MYFRGGSAEEYGQRPYFYIFLDPSLTYLAVTQPIVLSKG